MYIGPKNLGLINPNALGGAYPSVLFANNEVGVWYDAAGKDGASQAKIDSGLTDAAFLAAYSTHSLYQLSTGVTPAINPGDPIGLQIDISKGGLNNLGPEILTNGDFSNGTTGWNTVAGSTLTVNANNQLEIATGTQAISLNSDAITTVAGTTYLVEIDVIALSVGTQGVIVGTTVSGNNLLSDLRTTLGKRRAFFTATTTTSYLSWSCGSTSRTATIDNITIRAVPGNHRYQTATANRPLLARIPEGGRRNVLTNTEEFDNVAWSKVGAGSASAPTVVANQAIAPDGTNTADLITFTRTGNLISDRSYIQQNPTVFVSSGSYTQSIWLKAATVADVGKILVIRNVGAAGGYVQCVLTADWQRFSNTETFAVSNFNLEDRGVYGPDNQTTCAAHVWGAQLEVGSAATNYQKVTVNADATEAGKRDCWGVLYDGISDCFQTNAIDFSSTDKSTIWWSGRKLADSLLTIIVELSSSVSTNNGTFAFSCGTNSPYRYRFTSKGTLEGTAAVTNAAFDAPITNVIATIGDIGGDIATIRINGTQQTANTDDQGSGNYGNFALFFGARNAASLRFNGYEFAVIIRGATTSTKQINIFEKWMAYRAGIAI